MSTQMNWHKGKPAADEYKERYGKVRGVHWRRTKAGGLDRHTALQRMVVTGAWVGVHKMLGSWQRLPCAAMCAHLATHALLGCNHR